MDLSLERLVGFRSERRGWGCQGEGSVHTETEGEWYSLLKTGFCGLRLVLVGDGIETLNWSHIVSAKYQGI